jgi:hypothetical protein
VQVVADDPVPPGQLNAKVPRDLETICLKCLHKQPERRYASALALADDLRRWLDGQPILARPVTRVERLWKWARRRPAAAALAVLAVLAPVSLLVLGLVFNARVQQAQGEVDRRKRELAGLQDKVDQRDREVKESQIAVDNERKRATRLLRHADSLRLVGLSSLVLTDNPGRSLLLAMDGAERGEPREAAHNSALLAALEQNRELHTFTEIRPFYCKSVAFWCRSTRCLWRGNACRGS